MATAGAVGDTQDEMVKTLCLDNYNKEFHEQYKQLLEYLQTPIEKTDFQGGDNYRLNIVNSIFSNINFPIKQEYIDLVSEFYNVKFSELDFSDCSLVAKKINKFIELAYILNNATAEVFSALILQPTQIITLSA